MHKKLLWIFFLLCISVSTISVFAQVDVDYAAFRYDSTKSYWEVYYSIPRSQITYEKNKNGDYSCLVIIQMRIDKDIEKIYYFVKTAEILIKDREEFERIFSFIPERLDKGLLSLISKYKRASSKKGHAEWQRSSRV